jgi:dTDP-4-dehydrorhamnose 3,5-epimerase
MANPFYLQPGEAGPGRGLVSEADRKLEPLMAGVICRRLTIYEDQRGWLAEIFRQDELAAAHFPAMAYLSVTLPGVGRGPHAHRDQTDLFCFPGPGEFRLILWDQRPESPTFGTRQEFELGAHCPGIVIVPPGVVHGYKNIGAEPGWVCNFANRLYRGPGRREAVDEIRYEEDSDSPFRLD